MRREYNSLPSLLNTLAFVHTETDLERFRVQERKWIIVAVLLMLLIFFSTMTKTLSNAISHVQHHDWWNLTGDLLSPLPNTLILLTIPIAFKSIRASSSLAEKVLELRWRLNDEMLVPPVADQPLSIEAGELPFISTRIGPVRRVKNLSILLIGVSIFLLFIDVFLGAVIVGILPWIQAPDSAALNLWAALALSVLLFLCIIFTALVVVLVIRLFRANMVVADEWGLRWKWPNLIKGHSIALAWHEITGFYEMTGEVRKGNPLKTYLLDSPTGTFIWHMRENSTPKEQHASTCLTRLIATRTNLSLRDLTSAIEPLLNQLPEPKEMEEVQSSSQQQSY